MKAPRLHFFDTGLLCYLLGIREPGQLRLHPLRGAIFESWAVSEIIKARVHRAIEADLFHYRETRGLETDLLVDRAGALDAVEIQSDETISADFFKNLGRFSDRTSETEHGREPRCHVI